MFRLNAVVLVLVGLSVHAPGAQRADLQIFQDVRRQVLQYPQFTIFDRVHVEIEHGVATLRGKVTMPRKRTDIEARVRAVDGVSQVRNLIDVLPVSPGDDDLRLKIARAIYGNAAFRPYASMANPPIHIIVEHGRVTLEGMVNSPVDRILIHSIASSFDAFEVRNDLRTPAAPAAVETAPGR